MTNGGCDLQLLEAEDCLPEDIKSCDRSCSEDENKSNMLSKLLKRYVTTFRISLYLRSFVFRFVWVFWQNCVMFNVIIFL